ncbi:uncharacterized protein LOC115886902 [Sitophilus oryzae]|uniref:Male-enhanced antigen 1 n=1 Tax=Sitophilus oryzae TaxID=7048 RepID=A0A6J2YFH9_SITOR|nr:uncharacterized protein LOC115886902 [Sitophilus oryzae]
MGRLNTGLLNNGPGSDEVSPNRELEQIPALDSDSDESYYENLENYTLLSQNPTDGDMVYGILDTDSQESDNEEEIDQGVAASTITTAICDIPDMPFIEEGEASIVEEVSTQPAPKEVDIDMSQKVIELVKDLMLNIQLPNSSYPEWAKNVPEEEWIKHLTYKLSKSVPDGST